MSQRRGGENLDSSEFKSDTYGSEVFSVALSHVVPWNLTEAWVLKSHRYTLAALIKIREHWLKLRPDSRLWSALNPGLLMYIQDFCIIV